MWLIFLVFSVLCLILAAVFSFVINRRGIVNKKRFRLFNSLFAGVFFAAFLMFIPTYLSAAEFSVISCLRAVLLSIFNSIQVFAAGCDFSGVVVRMEQCPQWLSSVYQMWMSVVFVVAPMFAIGVVLSLFKNISATFKYLMAYFKDVYVFSELNDKSIVLARDIKLNHKDSVIVFTDVFEDNEEKVYELIEQARNFGAICFKKDILVINFKKHAQHKSIFFFAIGNDDTENLNQSLKLIENYRNRDNTHVYIFSTKIESALLLTTIEKGNVKVRRINEVLSLINRILYERGNIIFESAREDENGNKRISAIVIGMGNRGTEMLKALSWYCQMDGYHLEINAFDRDELAEEKFVALAPELMSHDYNGVKIEGEAQYKITIHPGIDVQTITFADDISKITNASYVFVALGNDDMNIKTAVNLRMYFERIKIHPIIQAVVYDSNLRSALGGIKNYGGQLYDIDFVGDIESSYAEDVIIDSELEKDALSRHMKWGIEEEFWNYEYNYRSSIASAIHLKARKLRGIPGATKKEEDLSEEENNILAMLEHRRWNAYMRSEGYVYSGSTEKTSRNDLAKMHHDLVDFSSLTDEEKHKDSKIGTS